MPRVVYEVKFTLTEGLENENSNKAVRPQNTNINADKKIKSNEEIALSKAAEEQRAKVVGYSSLAVSQGMKAVNMYYNYENVNYQISGDVIGAQKLQNQQALLNEIVGIGAGIGFGFAVGGIPGGIAAIAMTGINLGMKAYNHSLQVKKYVAQVESNIRESSYKQDRLVKNISEVR